MVDAEDELSEWSDDKCTQAEEPIEDRLRRAYLNGYLNGYRDVLQRGSWGGFDHS